MNQFSIAALFFGIVVICKAGYDGCVPSTVFEISTTTEIITVTPICPPPKAVTIYSTVSIVYVTVNPPTCPSVITKTIIDTVTEPCTNSVLTVTTIIPSGTTTTTTTEASDTVTATVTSSIILSGSVSVSTYGTTIVTSIGGSLTTETITTATTIFSNYQATLTITDTTTSIRDHLPPGPVIGLVIGMFAAGLLAAAIPLLLWPPKRRPPSPRPSYGGGGGGGYGTVPAQPPAQGY